MSAGRVIARTVVVTAIVTSLFWLAVAGWWYRHFPQPSSAPVVATVPAAPASVAAASRPAPLLAGTGDVPLLLPVSGVRPDRLVDTFSQARASGARLHDAIDIPAPRGTPVIAAAPGRVEKLFLSKDGGNTVYVRSPDGRRLYYYAHLDGYAAGLAEGATVKAGDAIGQVGSTGNADPAVPHLHFAIWETSPERKWWEQATAINPYPLLAEARPR